MSDLNSTRGGVKALNLSNFLPDFTPMGRYSSLQFVGAGPSIRPARSQSPQRYEPRFATTRQSGLVYARQEPEFLARLPPGPEGQAHIVRPGVECALLLQEEEGLQHKTARKSTSLQACRSVQSGRGHTVSRRGRWQIEAYGRIVRRVWLMRRYRPVGLTHWRGSDCRNGTSCSCPSEAHR